jgi:predicted ribosomally synthesized peptide with nif11-like leader
MTINKNEITKEMVGKAMQCETAEELTALAKANGFDLSKEEAEAYMAELADVELDEEQLKKAAGGGCYPDCKNDYCFEN